VRDDIGFTISAPILGNDVPGSNLATYSWHSPAFSIIKSANYDQKPGFLFMRGDYKNEKAP
jgi:hypothetical protein